MNLKKTSVLIDSLKCNNHSSNSFSFHFSTFPLFHFSILLLILFSSCSLEQKIASVAKKTIITDSTFLNTHVGLSVYDPESGKQLFGHQSDKLFTPASNTKLYSCYAAMTYLPSKLPAAYLTDVDTAVVITPTGDPSFLMPDFKSHPFFEKLKSINKPIYILNNNWKTSALGSGWSWDDYSEYYMTERSAFPVFGNQINWYMEKNKKDNPSYPGDTIDVMIYSDPEIDWPVHFSSIKKNEFYVERAMHNNSFTLYEGKEKSAIEQVPYITNGIQTGIALLKDSLHKEIRIADEDLEKAVKKFKADTCYSQPTDSLLKIMMYRSDNFFADQCLEMVSQRKFNLMDESAVIKDLLHHDLAELPQKPTWVDGSGLSRYTMFSPNDMIFILNKMKQEQSWERIKTILPHEGVGTLTMYKSNSNQKEFIYAKSGSLGNVLTLSGFLHTKKDKWLIFSIMINNTDMPFRRIRKQINAFLNGIAE